MTGIYDKVDTYEPKVNMGYENEIPEVEGQDSFKDIIDEHGNINIIINSDVIGQTLAKKIYTSWSSGLRELYNNEARACRMAKKMGGNPSIVITINPNEASRELIIQGVDSLGITKAMFNKVLRVIGTSGNQDGEEIGQFGMGFISYALLTDAVLLETWSRENNEHYAMLCDSGLKFKPIPLDTSNDVANMSEYGTKLTMTCNDSVNFAEAVGQIRDLARFSQIPTKIILLDNVESHSYRDQDWEKGIIDCPSYKNGMEYIKDTTDSMRRLNNSKATDDTKVLFYEEITIDNEDYRFDGIMVINKSRYGSISLMERHSSVPLLLAGTSVESQCKADGFMASIMNVKNERKYSPVASRDSLEYRAIDELNDRLKEDIIEYMSKFNMETIADYNASLNKCLLSRNVMWEIEDYLSEESKDISRTLNARYATTDGTSTLSDLLSVGGTLICLKSLRTDLMNALKDSFDSDVTFFRLSKTLGNEIRSHRIALFKQLNIIMGEDYKKEHSIKEKRTIVIKKDGTKATFNEDRSIILYNCTNGTNKYELFGNKSGWRSGSERYSTTIGEVNTEAHDKLITANTKQFNDVISGLNRYANDWKVMHDMKGLSEEINTFDNLMNSVADRYYQTHDGFVKGSELQGKYNVIVAGEFTALLESVDVTKGKHEDDNRQFIAVSSADDLTELIWYQHLIEPKSPLSDTDPLPPARFKIDYDVYGHKLSRNIFAPEEDDKYEREFKFYDHDYDKDRGVSVLRCYWINELLPTNYANVFIDAVQNNVDNLDYIEREARALNEVLKK